MRDRARDKLGCKRKGHAVKIVETLRRICGDCDAAGIVIPGTRQSGGRVAERWGERVGEGTYFRTQDALFADGLDTATEHVTGREVERTRTT